MIIIMKKCVIQGTFLFILSTLLLGLTQSTEVKGLQKLFSRDLRVSDREESTFSDIDNWSDRWQNATWMSYIKEDTHLSSLSIPGTHDSGAKNITSLVKTQTLDIEHQLYNGIRFLDVRTKVTDDGKLAIHHDAFYANLMFEDVLETSLSFLKNNPSETLYIRIKQEYSTVSNAEFTNVFMSYLSENLQEFIYTRSDSSTPDDPTIEDTKGKIVFFKNWNGGPTDLGIQYPGNFDIQDNYDSPALEEKIKNVHSQLDNAHQNYGNERVYLNYLNAYKLLSPIANYAKPINNDTVDYITNNKLTHTGIVISDFPGDQLINRVIDLNYKNAKEPNEVYDNANIVLRDVLKSNLAATWSEESGLATLTEYTKHNEQRWIMIYNPDLNAYKIINEKDSTYCLTPTILLEGANVSVSKDNDKVSQHWEISHTGKSNAYGSEAQLVNSSNPDMVLKINDNGDLIIGSDEINKSNFIMNTD